MLYMETYLVAWKCDQCESISPVCFIQLPQAWIIHILQKILCLSQKKWKSNCTLVLISTDIVTNTNNSAPHVHGMLGPLNTTLTSKRMQWFGCFRFSLNEISSTISIVPEHTCRGHSEATFTTTSTFPAYRDIATSSSNCCTVKSNVLIAPGSASAGFSCVTRPAGAESSKSLRLNAPHVTDVDFVSRGRCRKGRSAKRPALDGWATRIARRPSSAREVTETSA